MRSFLAVLILIVASDLFVGFWFLFGVVPLKWLYGLTLAHAGLVAVFLYRRSAPR